MDPRGEIMKAIANLKKGILPGQAKVEITDCGDGLDPMPPASSLHWERHRVDNPNSIARYIWRSSDTLLIDSMPTCPEGHPAPVFAEWGDDGRITAITDMDTGRNILEKKMGDV